MYQFGSNVKTYSNPKLKVIVGKLSSYYPVQSQISEESQVLCIVRWRINYGYSNFGI